MTKLNQSGYTKDNSKQSDYEKTVCNLVRYGMADEHELREFNLDILSGDLPHGINAPTFGTRKKMVMTNYLLNLFKNIFFVLVCLLVFSIMSFATISDFPNYDWFNIAVIIASGLGLLFFSKKILPNWHMFKLVKSVTEDSDTLRKENQVSNLSVHDEAEVARLFAKNRLAMRGFGLMLIIISSGFLYYVFTELPTSVSVFFYAMPLFFFMGVSSIIDPISPAELMHTHGTPTMSWRIMPAMTKLLLVLGCIGCLLLFIQFEIGIDLLGKFGIKFFS